jgi:hypothetical protein
MTTNLRDGYSNFKNELQGRLNGCSEVILLQVETAKMRSRNNKSLLQHVEVYENSSHRFDRSMSPGLKV